MVMTVVLLQPFPLPPRARAWAGPGNTRSPTLFAPKSPVPLFMLEAVASYPGRKTDANPVICTAKIKASSITPHPATTSFPKKSSPADNRRRMR